MYLYLDANKGRFSFFEDNTADFQWHAIEKDASLPRLIAPLLVKPLKGIVVEQGGGSFSQSREAVVFANMYAKTKLIPSMSIQKTPEDVKTLISDLHAAGTQILEPVYSGEPNIS